MIRYPQRYISAERQYVCQTLGITLGKNGLWVSDWEQYVCQTLGIRLGKKYEKLWKEITIHHIKDSQCSNIL